MSERSDYTGYESTRSRESKFGSILSDALGDSKGWLCGVCAEIANRWNIDVAIVRIVVVIAALIAPVTTIAVYLITWLVFFRK